MATNWPTSRDTFTNPSSSSTLDSPSHAAQHANINDAVEAMQLYAGLVLVKTQTIGSGVSSVTVTDAFSSTFENYKIIIQGHAMSGATNTMIALGNSATGSAYYGSFYYDNYSGASTGTARSSNATRLYITGAGTGKQNGSETTVINPFASERTIFTSLGYGNGVSGWSIGTHAGTSSYTSFTISPESGTMTGGTIRVYGYNNG